MKTWNYPYLRGKIWPKNFHDHLRGHLPFLKGIAKGANLTPCQTNQLYTCRQGLHSASTPVYVSGFITAVQMIRNVFSERSFMVQVLPGVCTDQIHHTLSWRLQSKQVKRSYHEWINNFIIANLISGIISLIWLLDEWCKIQIKPEFKTRILIGLLLTSGARRRENLIGVSICIICQGR